MSGPAERFGSSAPKLDDVTGAKEGAYIHEYVGELAETGEPVRVLTLAPDIADDEDATDAFGRVSDAWYNASANANVTPVRERDTAPRPWLAVPHAPEATLASVRDELSPEAIGTVVTESADALRTLGLYNTVHGHLSPADISIGDATDDGTRTVQVGGFGLEHAVRAAVGASEPTPYTAPELLEEPTGATERTDVYGLGAVTYFALTGRPPVEGDLDRAISEGATVPPSEHEDAVDPDLDEVVLRALSTRPAERQESPYAFERAFQSSYDPDAFDSPATDHGQEADTGAEDGAADEETDAGDERPAEEEPAGEAETVEREPAGEAETVEREPAETADAGEGGISRRAVAGAVVLGGVSAGAAGYLFGEPLGELTGTGAEGGTAEEQTTSDDGTDGQDSDGGAGSDGGSDQVTNRLEVVGTVGTDINDGRIGQVGIVITVPQEAGDVDLSATTVEFVHSSGATDLTFGSTGGDGSATTFGVQPIQDGGEPSLQGGSPTLDDPADRANLLIDTGTGGVTDGSLTEGDTATVQLTTGSGGTTELRLLVPETLAGNEAVSL